MHFAYRATRGMVSSVWVGCLVLAVVLVAEVPAAGTGQEPAPAARLLTFEEGLGIVNAAWEHQQQALNRPDCSHLVHAVYRFASLPYPYASSFDLYAGIPNFARVETPQPGDLVIWPGHVGIVVDPGQRSFYSSVRSGLRTEFYDSPYWRGRGPARFYRYVRGSGGNLAVVRGRPVPSAIQTTAQIITVPVVEEDREAPPGATMSPAEAVSQSAARVVAHPVSTAARPTFEIPASIRIVTRRPQPTRDEIAEAICELSNAAGNVLRSDDLLKLSHPVIIFDQLRVERVEIKGERGWAHVRIDSRMLIADKRINVKRRHEKRRWELRRTVTGWLVFTPLERVYVPSDVAVPVLAAQLALLTQNDVAFSDRAMLVGQQAQLARVLNALLEKK